MIVFFCVVEQMIDSNGNELFSQLSRKSIDTQSHEITPVQYTIQEALQFFTWDSLFNRNARQSWLKYKLTWELNTNFACAGKYEVSYGVRIYLENTAK